MTLLLLNDSTINAENDLELKKLVRLQFENDSNMRTWVVDLYDNVSFRWLMKIYFSNSSIKEADLLPKRIPKESIYIHIESDFSDHYVLSGLFNFYTIRNNAPAFVRDGGKLPTFEPHPYYLVFSGTCWTIQDSEFFNDETDGGYMKYNRFLLQSLKFTRIHRPYSFYITFNLRNRLFIFGHKLENSFWWWWRSMAINVANKLFKKK